ncbi:hypothetical protein [uncultured Alsobacter sp.]|uniref:hypothetical protein n=1 Tax=uncultured Alsobacter sp. TaxID=1748258 RepID=UPI0025FAED67|nr:hypothetical protein [uncultured Alsobacter sp.]
MHTDYQAVARQLEWLADDVPEPDTKQDLKALARNVRLLGVMTHVLAEARRRRRTAAYAAAMERLPIPGMLDPASPTPDRPPL